jgi:ribosomal protein S18
MAQKTDRKSSDRQSGGRKRPQTGPIKRKSCYFCKDKVDEIDYKNVAQLRRYVSESARARWRFCRTRQGSAPPGHTRRPSRRDHRARCGVLSRPDMHRYRASLRP